MNTPSAPHNGNGATHAPARAAGPVEARAARRERLLLLCAVDRARLRLLWRMPTKPPPPPRSFGSGLLSPPALAALLPWVPGKIGRWSRRIRTGATILRTVMRVAT
jgi:hypothetical protein